MSSTPVPPGTILKDELDEIGMSAAALARRLQVSENRLSEIMHGRRTITADTALRLGRWFGTSAGFWLNLQKSHDLRTAEQQSGAHIERIPPRVATAG